MNMRVAFIFKKDLRMEDEPDRFTDSLAVLGYFRTSNKSLINLKTEYGK